MRAVRILSRRSSALFVSVVLVLGVAGVASADEVSPINPNNRPTPLAGAVNGAVPASRLGNVAYREAGTR